MTAWPQPHTRDAPRPGVRSCDHPIPAEPKARCTGRLDIAGPIRKPNLIGCAIVGASAPVAMVHARNPAPEAWISMTFPSCASCRRSSGGSQDAAGHDDARHSTREHSQQGRVLDAPAPALTHVWPDEMRALRGQLHEVRRLSFCLCRRPRLGASKGGLITSTKVLAAELAPHNVPVNAIAPTVGHYAGSVMLKGLDGSIGRSPLGAAR